MTKIKKLDYSFYSRRDVVIIARDLLGKILVTRFEGILTSGRIVETEAYNGAVDKASHAYANRRTKRTEVMFGDAATAYVYLCYGIHHLFNIVTYKKEVPHAVLVRALEPLGGVEEMLIRTGKKTADHSLTRGPGNVSKALGLLTTHTGVSLLSDEVYIGDDGYRLKGSQIGIGPRIGVDYAEEDAALPYRFFITGNPYVSGKSTSGKTTAGGKNVRGKNILSGKHPVKGTLADSKKRSIAGKNGK
ncbi:MAG: DNA-3-methyladenine glycosylase [Puia sp.]|nr:DNA-3-methyladenine glycosylase [Puia sp.]